MGKILSVFLALIFIYPAGALASYGTAEPPAKPAALSDFEIVVLKAGAYRPYVKDEPLNSELDEFIARALGIVFADTADIPSQVGAKFGLIFFCQSKIVSSVVGEITVSYDPPLVDMKTGRVKKPDHVGFISPVGEWQFYGSTVLKVIEGSACLVRIKIKCFNRTAVRMLSIVPAK